MCAGRIEHLPEGSHRDFLGHSAVRSIHGINRPHTCSCFTTCICLFLSIYLAIQARHAGLRYSGCALRCVDLDVVHAAAGLNLLQS
jgi:hypothetical protein